MLYILSADVRNEKTELIEKQNILPSMMQLDEKTINSRRNLTKRRDKTNRKHVDVQYMCLQIVLYI